MLSKMTFIHRYCLLVSALTFLHWGLAGQMLPFQKSMAFPGYRLGDVVANEADDIRGITYSPPSTTLAHKLILFQPNELQDTLDALEIYPPQIGSILFSFFQKGIYQGTSVNLLQGTNPLGALFIHYDTESGSLWAKSKATPGSGEGFSTDTNGNTLIAFTGGNASGSLQLYYFAPDGTLIWQKGINFIKPEFAPFKLLSYDVLFDAEANSFFVLGHFIDITGINGEQRSFLIQVYPDGSPGSMLIAGDINFKKLIQSNNGFFAIGSMKDTTGVTGNENNAIVAKFDKELNLLWSKVFYGEAFEYNDLSLLQQSDGSLLLGYSTTGFFPAVLATLDANGNIVSQRGYPFHDPKIIVLGNGALLLSSQQRITPEGELLPNFTIARTDSLGLLDDCPVFPACLQSFPVSLELSSFSTSISTIDSLIAVSLAIDTVQILLTDVCQSPTEPSAFFTVPDTICVGESISTSNTSNSLASKNRWELFENGMPLSAIENTPDFQHSFSEPGVYTLTQTIWYLGCLYSHEQTIVVLPELEASIEQDGTYCTPPLELTVHSNRPISSYNWSGNIHSTSLEVLQGGFYQVTVGDGFCEASASTEINFTDELLQGEAPIAIPPDTTLCEIFLPYELYAETPFDTGISINGKPVENWPELLPTEGLYTLSIEVDHCVLTDTFRIAVDSSCAEVVFLPNAFSPNGDGFNELFLAQGKNFIPVKLTIFNRWGSMVAEITTEPFAWDGQDANSGIYIYLFEYINPLTGMKGTISGDVLLFR